jgi:hypothetical protein
MREHSFPTAPAFHPSDEPHCDFLITAKLSPDSRRKMIALGAAAETYKDCEIYSWGFQLKDSTFLGVGLADGRFVIGPAEIDDVEPIKVIGTCCVLSKGRDGVTIRPDFHGLYALYSGADFVTNRLHLAALLSGKMDEISTVAPLYNNNLIFWDQATTWDTCVDGVKLAPPFSEFKAYGGQVVRKDIARFDYGILEPDEYWDLVSKGASEIRDNVEAVLNSGYRILCDITGGQDSRILLGAIVSLGRIRDVSFHTKETKDQWGKADLAIGSGLVKEFGGTYEFESNTIGYKKISLTDAWELRRSRLFGSYHFVRPAVLAPGQHC